MSINDDKLNQLLKGVKPIPSSSNLAERIIFQAATPKVVLEIENDKKSLFKQILHSFIIPKPAYALACSMLIGVLFGWQISEVDSNKDAVQLALIDEDLSSLFIAEVNFYE